MASEIKVDTIVNAGGDNDTGIDLATNDQILLKVANATKLTMNSTGQTTIVGEGGNTLSGGQKQRISIARAILKDAPILLLDEATSSLDAETENEITKTLEKLTKNKTTITIAHKLSTLINSDQIILFDKGKIVGMGNHKELIKSSNYYQRLYNAGT